MARNQQLKRVYMLLLYLQERHYGASLKELHEYLMERKIEVDERTVRRDIAGLIDIGFEIYNDPNSNNYRINRNVNIQKYLSLTPNDLLALSLCRSMLTPLKDTPFYQDVQSFFDKLDTFMGQKNRDYLAELNQEIVMEPAPKWGLGTDSDVLDTVRDACIERMILTIRYDSGANSNKAPRRVGPQFIYLSRGSLYLVAYDFAAKTNKTFQFPAIKEAAKTDEPFEGEEINAEEYFKDSLGVYRADKAVPVKIRVQKELSSYVSSRNFHASQKNVKKEDGSLEVNWEVGITPELVQIILSWGRHAEVLTPIELREAVVGEAERIVKTYKGG